MTFDTAISTTWGAALHDIYEKVGALTNWTQKDSTGTGDGTMNKGDYFVLTTPGGEDVKFHVDPQGRGNAEITLEHGPNWDSGSGTWGDEYSGSPSNHLANNKDEEITFAPLSDDGNPPSAGDNVQYWLAYSDADGFAFYAERNESDGSDSALFVGFSKLTEVWDYDTADSRESNNCWSIHGYRNMEYENYGNKWKGAGTISKTETWDFLPAGPGGVSPGTVTATGRPNADANFSNFPMVEESAVASRQFSDTIIGTHTTWMKPLAGADGDTVEDSNGNKIYTLLKRDNDGLPLVGVRHL